MTTMQLLITLPPHTGASRPGLRCITKRLDEICSAEAELRGLEDSLSVSVERLTSAVAELLIPPEKRSDIAVTVDPSLWRLKVNGKAVAPDADSISVPAAEPFVTVDVVGRLLGGKGGFGTLLRGKGGRGPKTVNFESSRDLQGRRLRAAKAPERMRQWVERKVHEHEIIKAVGGEDPFIGKQMTSAEVVQLYGLQIKSDVFNPFIEEEAVDEAKEKTKSRAHALVVRAAAGLPVAPPSPPAEVAKPAITPAGAAVIEPELEQVAAAWDDQFQLDGLLS